MTVSKNGTNGRVYGGDCGLVHIADGTRKFVGQEVAVSVERIIRQKAASRMGVSAYQLPLCPGCTMIALFNAAIILADANGQDRQELALTMARAFTKLAFNPDAGLTEEIEIVLDKE